MQKVIFNALSDAKCNICKTFIYLLFIFKVNKEVSAQADKMKELYSAIDRMDFQVMNLNKKIEQLQQQKIKFQARSASRDAHIAQLVRNLREK